VTRKKSRSRCSAACECVSESKSRTYSISCSLRKPSSWQERPERLTWRDQIEGLSRRFKKKWENASDSKCSTVVSMTRSMKSWFVFLRSWGKVRWLGFGFNEVCLQGSVCEICLILWIDQCVLLRFMEPVSLGNGNYEWASWIPQWGMGEYNYLKPPNSYFLPKNEAIPACVTVGTPVQLSKSHFYMYDIQKIWYRDHSLRVCAILATASPVEFFCQESVL